MPATPTMPPRGISAGAKGAAEEACRSDEELDLNSAGAEAHFVLIALSARLMSCPVTKPHRIGFTESFSAACKAPSDFARLAARLKSCPDTVLFDLPSGAAADAVGWAGVSWFGGVCWFGCVRR